MYTDMTYNMQGDMVTKFSLGSTLTPADGILEVYVYDDNGNLTDTIINPGYQEKVGEANRQIFAIKYPVG